MKYLKKMIIFITLIFLLIILIYKSFYLTNKNHIINFNDIIINRKENKRFVSGIKINNTLLCYDADNNVYYYPVNNFNISSVKIISPYTVKYSISKICESEYELFIYSEKYYQTTKIKAVNLPIISINTKTNFLTRYNNNFEIENIDNNNLVGFTLYDNNYKINNSKWLVQSFIGNIRTRGVTSLLFEKKSYKIESKTKISLLGMDYDDDWILDALYTDKSKIRNKLSSDLWNLINNNQTINNDLEGQFIEVFINNKYNGLYVLKEKVDKKIAGTEDDGILVKLIDQIGSKRINNLIPKNFGGHLIINNEKIIENYEMKYYTIDSLNKFLIRQKEFNNANKTYDVYSNYFDIDNFINYKIFLSLISGVDNITKNQYYSMKNEDSKIFITPWDMDLTFGLEFSATQYLYSIEKMDDYNDNTLLDTNITNNMDEQTLNILKQRYWELRKDTITMDNINKYLDEYKELLVSSGAAKRDSDRWYDYDIEYEIEQIRKWANNRIIFLDEYFKI